MAAGQQAERLLVRVTTRAARDAVDGEIELPDGRRALVVRVRAVPEAGKANAAVCALVAAHLGRPPSQARVVSGGTSRLKVIEVG